MSTDKHYLWHLAGAKEFTQWMQYRGSGFDVGYGAKGVGFSGGGQWFMRSNVTAQTKGGHKYAY